MATCLVSTLGILL